MRRRAGESRLVGELSDSLALRARRAHQAQKACGATDRLCAGDRGREVFHMMDATAGASHIATTGWRWADMPPRLVSPTRRSAP